MYTLENYGLYHFGLFLADLIKEIGNLWTEVSQLGPLNGWSKEKGLVVELSKGVLDSAVRCAPGANQNVPFLSFLSIFTHRVASTPELATNFIDYKQMAGMTDGKKKLLLYCFITALCVKMDIFLSEHIYLWNIHPTMIWKWFLVDFFTVIVAAW